MKNLARLPLLAAVLLALLLPATPAFAAALKVTAYSKVTVVAGSASKVVFTAKPNKKSRVRVTVYQAGHAIRTMTAVRSGTKYNASWNLRTSAGARVAPGVYTYRATATAGGKSKAVKQSVRIPVPAPVVFTPAWVGFYSPGAPGSMAPIDTLESKIGGQAAVVNFFVADTEAFPTSRCNNIVANGSTPLITLEFWSTQSGGLSAITNGSKDAYLRSFAASAKSFGTTVWLRPFHEMNGNWYPWGDTSANSPAKLIAAYRHVHDIFAAEGATNVKFVWCPNVDFAISEYYPGNAYVDYAAIDGYNNAIPWRSFSNIFGPTYKSVAAVSSKPIFIAETSCVESGSRKAAWITDMFGQIRTAYPRIVGVCWFDASLTYDWRVDTSAASVAAFKAGVTKGF
jgi:hypothetical protein